MKKENCIFCNLPKEAYILENDLAYAVYDINPDTKGHMLIITKNHYVDFFATPKEDMGAIRELIIKAKEFLDKEYSPKGYKIKTNIGAAAGQVVFHTHMHLIPKY